jgi:hypothetical protein
LAAVPNLVHREHGLELSHFDRVFLHAEHAFFVTFLVDFSRIRIFHSSLQLFVSVTFSMLS